MREGFQVSELIRILCVDDEQYVLKALKRMFLESRCEVLTATSAVEGLSVIRNRGQMAVVISDFRMPGMNGVDFLKEVYRQWPDTIRIILSGYADVDTVLTAINTGHVDKFIPKPWDDEELIRIVNDEIHRYVERVGIREHTDMLQQGISSLTESNLQLSRVVDAQNAALRASEGRLKKAQRIARLGDWEWNAGTGEMSWSDEMFHIHGVCAVSFVPSLEAYKGLLFEEDRETFIRQIRSSLEGSEDYCFEHRIMLTSGEIRLLEVRGNIWQDIDGNPVGLRATSQDVTERARLTAELRQANEQLEERVKIRTADLQSALEELDGFASAVSHDLRAPLAQILGYARILTDNLGSCLDDENARILQRIVKRVHSSNEMVNALLELSRITRTPFEFEDTDLSAIAEEVAAQLLESDQARRVTFRITKGMHARGDRKMLRIMLENILGNAWKYTSKKMSALISFECRQIQGEQVFTVTDDGAGFDMAYAGKLFRPFERLHSKEEFAGHGVGLTTVEKIVSRHSGRIWAESTPEQGATFFFTLGQQ